MDEYVENAKRLTVDMSGKNAFQMDLMKTRKNLWYPYADIVGGNHGSGRVGRRF